MKLTLLLSLLLALAACAAAQPPREPPTNSFSARIQLTDAGYFVLLNGVLALYKGEGLKPAGVCELFGPRPAVPLAGDLAVATAYNTDLMRRQAPALLLPSDDILLIVIGDRFFRVDPEGMKVLVTTSLSKPGVESSPAVMFGPALPPAHLLNGDQLLLTLGDELLAVDVTDGRVSARVTLPAEMRLPTYGSFRPLPAPGGQPANEPVRRQPANG